MLNNDNLQNDDNTNFDNDELKEEKSKIVNPNISSTVPAKELEKKKNFIFRFFDKVVDFFKDLFGISKKQTSLDNDNDEDETPLLDNRQRKKDGKNLENQPTIDLSAPLGDQPQSPVNQSYMGLPVQQEATQVSMSHYASKDKPVSPNVPSKIEKNVIDNAKDSTKDLTSLVKNNNIQTAPSTDSIESIKVKVEQSNAKTGEVKQSKAKKNDKEFVKTFKGNPKNPAGKRTQKFNTRGNNKHKRNVGKP